jgi:hypothetical protein
MQTYTSRVRGLTHGLTQGFARVFEQIQSYIQIHADTGRYSQIQTDMNSLKIHTSTRYAHDIHIFTNMHTIKRPKIDMHAAKPFCEVYVSACIMYISVCIVCICMYLYVSCMHICQEYTFLKRDTCGYGNVCISMYPIKCMYWYVSIKSSCISMYPCISVCILCVHLLVSACIYCLSISVLGVDAGTLWQI